MCINMQLVYASICKAEFRMPNPAWEYRHHLTSDAPHIVLYTIQNLEIRIKQIRVDVKFVVQSNVNELGVLFVHSNVLDLRCTPALISGDFILHHLFLPM